MTMRKGQPAKLAATDANDTRYDYNNDVVCNADGSPRGGVTSPIGTNIITGTATMNVSVNLFAAVAVRDAGVVKLANDGPVNVLIGAAPVSNQRTDIIYAKQDDSSSTVSTPDGDDNPILGVVVGTAGPSGGTPGIVPVGGVEIGRIILTAGNTSTNAAQIVQVGGANTGGYTASSGGHVPFRTLAALQLWTNAAPYQHASVIADTTSSNNGDYFLNGSTWTQLEPGLNMIVPTSIASTGGSSSLGAGGRVNYSAVTALSVMGCFGAGFDNYMVVWEFDVVATTANNIPLRLRAATTDLIAAVYNYAITQVASSTPSSNFLTGQTSAPAAHVSASGDAAGTITFFNPNRLQPTEIIYSCMDSAMKSDGGISVRNSLAYDGFSLLPPSPTAMTGTLRVYGYNNG